MFRKLYDEYVKVFLRLYFKDLILTSYIESFIEKIINCGIFMLKQL